MAAGLGAASAPETMAPVSDPSLSYANFNYTDGNTYDLAGPAVRCGRIVGGTHLHAHVHSMRAAQLAHPSMRALAFCLLRRPLQVYSSGLSKGQVAGIVIGCVLAGVLMGSVVTLCWLKRRRLFPNKCARCSARNTLAHPTGIEVHTSRAAGARADVARMRARLHQVRPAQASKRGRPHPSH